MAEDNMNIFWFRRDLRITDNPALKAALAAEGNTLPLFIFDEEIIDELPDDDARLSFIYDQLYSIHKKLRGHNSGIYIARGKPEEVFTDLLKAYPVKHVYTNRDYEPYSIQRDRSVEQLLHKNNVEFKTFKDHVVFEPGEILKADGKPYTVYTPYKNAWYKKFNVPAVNSLSVSDHKKFHPFDSPFPALEDLGFRKSKIRVKDFDLSVVSQYHLTRDIPHLDGTSRLGPHLRFGTVSIREVIDMLNNNYGVNNSFLNELIWREFFIQVLYHFPYVCEQNFRSKYDDIRWRNNEEEFEKWCAGTTGYPIVDAGMCQLNETGYMHNRVRMITAGFLCKHLLIDWRWGEGYFALKLLDFELSSNNGNWQWSAGTGCDAAPYFRIFNPVEQTKKFDPDLRYIRRWVNELDSSAYPDPMVDHKFARQRALETYKRSL